MSNPTLVFSSFAMLIGLFILGVISAQAIRGRAVRERWKRTSGTVLEFGMTHGAPTVLYCYEVNGVSYEGRCITRGWGNYGHKGVRLSKQTYLDERDGLRYPPEKVVTVYYDPEKPEDAALYAGSTGGGVVPLLVATLLIGGAFYGAFGPSLGKSDILNLAGWGMSGIAILFFTIGTRLILLHLRNRQNSRTEGRVLNAAVTAVRVNNRTNYQLEVNYDYTVQGVRYVSGQLSAFNIRIGGNREKLEQEAAVYRENPTVQVWYDPRAPWKCYLRQGPVVGICIPFLFAVVFGGVGVMILINGF